MAQVLVRDLEDSTLQALKGRAKANKRSTQAEIRAILDRAACEPALDQRSLMSLVGAGRSETSFRTTDEIVAYVRALRDE